MFALLAGCVDAAPVATVPSPAPTPEPTTPPPPPPPPPPPTVPPETLPSALTFTGPKPVNLLYVSVDTTRRDHLSRFVPSDNTPNLDDMLQGALVFEDHRSCSNWTGPSMTCALTGATPLALGFWPWSTDPLIHDNAPSPLPTLAQDLADQGYRTALVTANTVIGPGVGLNRGFAFREDLHDEPAPVVVERALEVLDFLQSNPEPWYLHTHFMDPHAEYCAPDEHLDLEDYVDLGYDLCAEGGFLRFEVYPTATEEWQAAFENDMAERYEAEIEYWDVWFGLFWAELEARHALDDTLVVFLTDHGEQHYERGEFGHKKQLGSEEVRAGAALWADTLVPGAFTGPTVHEDVVASVRDVFGLPVPAVQSGVVVGRADPHRAIESLNVEPGEPVQLSVVQDNVNLLYDTDGERWFYRMASDPTGLTDVYDPTDPDVIASWAPMTALVDRVYATWPHLPPPVSPAP